MSWVTSLLVNKGNKTQLSNALAISKKQGRKKKKPTSGLKVKTGKVITYASTQILEWQKITQNLP